MSIEAVAVKCAAFELNQSSAKAGRAANRAPPLAGRRSKHVASTVNCLTFLEFGGLGGFFLNLLIFHRFHVFLENRTIFNNMLRFE